MKIKINSDSGKKNVIISDIGSFKLGEVYELNKKDADICLRKTVRALNPLNKSQVMEIPVFVEVKDSENVPETKKGGTNK